MRYEGYTSKERLDDILDKISKYGIDSLNSMEQEFLDSHKSGDEEEIHKKISIQESENIFEDDSGYFRFEHKETEDYGNEMHFIGTIYVPDLALPNGRKVEGRLTGKMVANLETGQVDLDFEFNGYDIYEFCSGVEYELDSFIDYVVAELSEKKS